MNELREEIELPAYDDTCEAIRAYAATLESGAQYSIASLKGEKECRERQLKSSLEANRELQDKLSEALAEHGKTLLTLNEAAFMTIPKLEAANREQKAEIERLKACTQLHNDSAVEAWQLTQKWQKRVFDLEAELRASVGEKPEDAWKRGYLAGALHVSDDLGVKLCGLAIDEYIAPTLPGEEK
jgi:hypothetical protein